jgi:tRNA A37 threonylcarbamoyladenosine synthetase subunit TsaC/SUA5/YrdC
LLTGDFGTLAIRLPQPAYMQAYLQAAAIPLVSTSLNISGEAPATHAAAIPTGTPSLTLNEPLSGTPSRIFNPMTNQWLR